MWECNECEFENDLDPDIEEEQIVICAECGAEFEVLKLEPLELSEAREGVTADVDADAESDDAEEDEPVDDNWE